MRKHLIIHKVEASNFFTFFLQELDEVENNLNLEDIELTMRFLEGRRFVYKFFNDVYIPAVLSINIKIPTLV